MLETLYHTGELISQSLILKGLMPNKSWPPRLADDFAKQGFREIDYKRYETSPELRMFFTQMQFMIGEEYSFAMMDNSNPHKGGPAHRRRIQEAAEESREGAGMHFIPEVTVGRKPL